MAFTSGNIVSASDYTSLMENVKFLMQSGSGSIGFGQNNLYFPNINSNEITIPNKLSLIGSYVSNAHQHVNGNYIPFPTPSVGSILSSNYPSTIMSYYDIVYNNRLSQIGRSNYNNLEVAATYNTTGYQVTRNALFEFVFTSLNNARYFFNGGGGISIYLSHPTGTSNGPNYAFHHAASQMGTVTLNANSVTKSGSRGILYNADTGFYGLQNGTWKDLVVVSDIGGYGGATYSSNYSYIKIEASTNSGGRIIRFNVKFRNWFLKAGGYFKYGKSTEAMYPGFKLYANTLKKQSVLTNPTIPLPFYSLIKNF